MTTDDPDAIALRPPVTGGARQDDDYEVVWRGFPVGRMMKQPDGPHWWWACTVYGLPPTPNDRGPRHQLQGLPGPLPARLDQNQAHADHRDHRGCNAARPGVAGAASGEGRGAQGT